MYLSHVCESSYTDTHQHSCTHMYSSTYLDANIYIQPHMPSTHPHVHTLTHTHKVTVAQIFAHPVSHTLMLTLTHVLTHSHIPHMVTPVHTHVSSIACSFLLHGNLSWEAHTMGPTAQKGDERPSRSTVPCQGVLPSCLQQHVWGSTAPAIKVSPPLPSALVVQEWGPALWVKPTPTA